MVQARVVPEPPYPEGPRLQFRPLAASDALGAYLRWINDPRVKQFLVSRFERLESADLEAYIRQVNELPDALMFAVCDRATGDHLGNGKLYNINRDHGSADLSVVIGEVSRWRQGLGTETVAMLTAHAFRAMGLRRLSAGCYVANEASTRAFLKCGYQKEGIARGLHILDGQAHDCQRLGILACDERRWEAVLLSSG
jgi:RimJ/RimL family protein N-acetyltransferase